ncbi:hypothetical protein IW249_002856 [Micromonospora vinacea]|uniref:Uncharacterized protein n=1 Tax=Micromonospora vinacea TaxID=709878 RepID=A0ABS0K1E4_9ACTN|nr:hypothetical protein [Micromonospora vinacea]
MLGEALSHRAQPKENVFAPARFGDGDGDGPAEGVHVTGEAGRARLAGQTEGMWIGGEPRRLRDARSGDE